MIEDNPELLLELNTLAMKSRITRWESLQYEIDKQLNKLAITTEKETKELLTDTLNLVVLACIPVWHIPRWHVRFCFSAISPAIHVIGVSVHAESR